MTRREYNTKLIEMIAALHNCLARKVIISTNVINDIILNTRKSMKCRRIILGHTEDSIDMKLHYKSHDPTRNSFIAWTSFDTPVNKHVFIHM